MIARAVSRVLDPYVHDALLPMLTLLAGKDPVPVGDMSMLLAALQEKVTNLKNQFDELKAEQGSAADEIQTQAAQLNAML